MSANKQILVTSANKAVTIAKQNGKLDFKYIALFGIINYYIEFSTNIHYFNDANRKLQELASGLKYKYPDIICNYKNLIGVTPRETGNTPPTVGNISINLGQAETYTFSASDFTNVYSDADADTPSKVKLIYSASPDGHFTYNGVVLMSDIEFNVSNSSLLAFHKDVGGVINVGSSFRMTDGIVYSNTGNITLTTAGDNQPAEVGDNTITADNRVTTTFTLAMFTTNLQPPYNDPEGDLIDAIRIDEINNANKGSFFMNGIEIAEGQIVTRENINAGLFIHIGPDLDSLWADSFSFSARDEGSKIWVQ